MPEEVKFVKGQEVVVTAIQAEMNNQNQDEIRRFRFVSESGDITWKPKVQSKELIKGIEILKTQPMLASQIPDKIVTIQAHINQYGMVKLKANYSKMDTENAEGTPVTYRFIQSEKTLGKWEILPQQSTQQEPQKQQIGIQQPPLK